MLAPHFLKYQSIKRPFMTKQPLLNTLFNLPPDDLNAWAKQNHPNLTPDFINEGKQLAEESAQTGEIDHALFILDRLMLVAEQGEDPLTAVPVWRGRANVYQTFEKYDEALNATAQAVAILEQHGIPYDIAVARTGEVSLRGALAQFQDAIDLAHWILPHFEQANFTLGLATVTFNLAMVHGMAWQLNEGIKLYNEALPLYTQLEMPNMVANIHHNMGVLLGRHGQATRAQQAYHKAYPQFITSENVFMQVKTLFNLAEISLQQGQYEDALTHLETARTPLANMPDVPDHGFVDLFEARVRLQLNQPAEAEQLLHQAVTQFQTTRHPLEAAETLIELGHLLADQPGQEKLAAGLDCLEQAAHLLVGIEAPFFKAWIQLDQAEMLYRLGRINEAAAYAKTAVSIFKTEQLPLRHAQANALLADCQHTQPENAKSLYTQALDTVGSADPLLSIRCWRGLGTLAFAEQDVKTAVFNYKHAIDLIETMRYTINSHKHRAGFLENKQSISEGLLSALHLEPGHEQNILTWVEQFKATALADIIGQAPPDDTLEKPLQHLQIQREKLATTLDHTLTALHTNTEAIATAQRSTILAAHDTFQTNALTHIRKQINSVDAKIARHHDPTKNWRNGSPISPKKIHTLLDNDTVLISYYVANGQLHALTATNTLNDVQIHPLLTNLAQVSQQWQQARRHVARSKRPLTAVQSRLSRLWQTLIAPLLPRLQHKSRLIILPHRALFHIPFAGLYDATQSQYLIDRWVVQIAPSASILSWCQQRNHDQKQALLVGYPGQSGQPGFLPAVEDELVALEALLPNVDVLFDQNATRENVLNNMHHKGLIHLAGHAIFNSVAPLESGMPLANGRWLRAADLYNRHNHLDGSTVVLSGCETGRGQLNGSDVLGFTSAFLYAGAAAVIAGLWRVDDAGTAVLMRHLYQNLAQGHPTAAALCQAQRTLRHTPEFSAPYYWAPFILNGANHLNSPYANTLDQMHR
ncbi:MAG: CHAT domain-containing protein [Chloroflexi bacterium]|nr:CHAT domain-containing protein [Chloroflexota bacterium]